MSRAFTMQVLSIAAFEELHRKTPKVDGRSRQVANNYLRAARRLRDGVFEGKERKKP